MHSDLFGLCRVLRGRGIRLTLLSSGLLLDRFASEIVDHLDDVIVSLDGPPAIHDRIRRVEDAFANLEAGVARLRQLRPGFQIAARCTVQRDNAAWLVDTVRTAHDLGLNSISFLAVDLVSDAFDHRPGSVLNVAPEISTLRRQIEKIIVSGECEQFVLESPEKLRRIIRHFAGGQSTSPVCNAPWVSAVVEANGTVRPCFFHRPVGSLSGGQSLYDVVNGPEAITFRNSLDVTSNPICQRCVCSLNWRSVSAPAVHQTLDGTAQNPQIQPY